MSRAQNIGRHEVWTVAPSRETQERCEDAVAYDCENCALRAEGDEGTVFYLLHNRPCPVSQWEESRGLHNGGEGR